MMAQYGMCDEHDSSHEVPVNVLDKMLLYEFFLTSHWTSRTCPLTSSEVK